MSAAAVALALAACGGGGGTTGGDPVLTGVFVDSAVGGIGFRTATRNGVTNDAGDFSYLEGRHYVETSGCGETARHLSIYIPRYEDECNSQIDCTFEFAADGTMVRRATGELDENATWEINNNGNLQITFVGAGGIADGEVRIYVKNATADDISYRKMEVAVYVDGTDQEYAVLVAATLTRVE